MEDVALWSVLKNFRIEYNACEGQLLLLIHTLSHTQHIYAIIVSTTTTETAIEHIKNHFFLCVPDILLLCFIREHARTMSKILNRFTGSMLEDVNERKFIEILENRFFLFIFGCKLILFATLKRCSQNMLVG